jgi:TM2 domain-containing membrane protein YozV
MPARQGKQQKHGVIGLWAELFLSWLIPGSGFVLRKQYVRGIVLFLLINVTFMIGVFLHGAVAWPIWNPRTEEGFNIVNNFTFIVELGNGLLSLLSLVGHQLMPNRMLTGQEWNANFDLAAFYLLVSGGMNYFVVCHFYDRFSGKARGKDRSHSG